MKFLILASCLWLAQASFAQPRWEEGKANSWYKHQPWLVGSNFIPSDAVNQLEMWQSDTFNPEIIDKELGLAENLGMNSARVFLHDLVWQEDTLGFQRRIEAFLTIANKHRIKPIFVLFDSCWDPYPHPGPQREPTPGVHNSRWVQSPGATALADPVQAARLQAYVKGVVGLFGKDRRILAWDMWNEPDNGMSAYGRVDLANKSEVVVAMLPKVFQWARSEHPVQPLTSGLWTGDWSALDKMNEVERIQVGFSDVISFHNYGKPDDFERRVKWLQQYHRPILCTEYMARPQGSTFEGILPIAKKYKVGAYNWGLVNGKTQTNLPWDSWEHPYVTNPPAVWFHDIFRADGTPYSAQEFTFIRGVTKQ